jgi:tetratricopeptide (TPR) repeat protein
MYDSDNEDYINYEEFPDYFENFNNSLKQGISPGYYEPDELCEIVDIYFSEGKVDEGKYTINYALKMYPENEEMIYELLLILNDFELWNDLLTLSEKYSNLSQVWADGHKLTSLLHLGMEEDAFQYFKTMKSKYAGDEENLSIIYQAMAEALYEVDLYDAAIEVIEEILPIVGEDIDLLWLELQSFAAIEDKESVAELGARIQNLNPMDAETWSRLGNAYKEVNDIKKSIEAYEFAQSLGIEDPNNLLSLISAYEKNGNFSKALQKIDEYLTEYPDSYVVCLLAINICSEIENWSEGLKYVENAIRLDPQMESLYLYKCKFYLRLGENRKAIKALEEGIDVMQEGRSEDLKKQLNELKNNQ